MKEYPGIAVETVSDSSRYFVLRIQDGSGEDVNMSVLYLCHSPFRKRNERVCSQVAALSSVSDSGTAGTRLISMWLSRTISSKLPLVNILF